MGKSDGQDIASPFSQTSRESKGHKMEDYIGSNDTALVGRISFTKRFDQTFVELGPTQTKSLVALSWQFNLFSRVYLFSRFLPKCFLMIFATIFAPKTHCAALR